MCVVLSYVQSIKAEKECAEKELFKHAWEVALEASWDEFDDGQITDTW